MPYIKCTAKDTCPICQSGVPALQAKPQVRLTEESTGREVLASPALSERLLNIAAKMKPARFIEED